jgi:hypothetical protein
VIKTVLGEVVKGQDVGEGEPEVVAGPLDAGAGTAARGLKPDRSRQHLCKQQLSLFYGTFFPLTQTHKQSFKIMHFTKTLASSYTYIYRTYSVIFQEGGYALF